MAEIKAGDPLWWVEKLDAEMRARAAHMRLMDAYHCGEHPLPFVTQAHNAKMRSEFRGLLEDCRSNFMRLVVEAVEERLRVEGFRLSAETDPVADQDAWKIWQANQLDAEVPVAFTEALVKGVSYLSVWEGDEYASIAVEDPLQTIVGYVPGTNFRQRAAALKVWTDDWTGDTRANLYLPRGIHKFVRKDDDRAAQGGSQQPTEERSPWKELDDSFVGNPLGIVPIVPLRNRPRLLHEGESEIADQVAAQDRINGQLFMRALAGYFGAHRQRWAVGLKIHEDDQGNPIEPFDVAIDKLWQTEDPEVRFGEFSQTDLGGYIKAIDQDVQHIAVTSRTPRHYLLPSGQEPSGDSINSADAGIVKKAERKHGPFGEGLEEAIRLARMFQGEEDAPVDSEIVWADPRIRNEAQITDGVIKKFQAGLIPWEVAVADLGYSQTEIARMRTLRNRDQLLRSVLGPPPGGDTEPPEEEPDE